MNIKGYLVWLSVTLTLAGCAKPDSDNKQYIVVLKKGVVSTKLNELSSNHSLDNPKKIFTSALRGGVYELNEDQLVSLAEDPDVAYIEEDHVISINAIQNNVTWGLDRVDQESLPLDNSYNFPAGGSFVNAYVIDTGILTSHSDFQGRAVHGIDLVDNDNNATDCNGHGTHVAGTIGSATYGVAKNVKLHGVRVLDCNGSGRFSDVISGIEWVTANHISPAVANLSLGGPVSQAVDDAVKASIQSGVTYVVAAGNSNTSACSTSPSRVAEAITVGSTTSSDARSSFSNYGSCVDIFAPGSDIKSLWYNSNSATNTISGTSMASPHVAGVVALYLSSHPSATPAEVTTALLAGATSGKVSNGGSGSPNKLLNSAFANIPPGGGGEDPGGTNPPGGGSGGVGLLVSGVPVNNISDARNDEVLFAINVPENSAQLLVEISGGSGDADLYLRFASEPTVALYDCRPYKSGNLESCSQSNPRAGKWYVMVRAYADYSDLTLKATVVKASDPGCAGCGSYTGSLSARGDSIYLPNTAGYSNAGGLQQILLEGPEGTDFDLYLYKLSGATWSQVASSTSIKSLEQINYSGTAGSYRIKVYSYNGAGAFKLTVK